MGTLPSRKRRAPVIPLLPTTIRSALVSSATLRIASDGRALDRVGLDLDPVFLGGRGGGVEHEVDVLARADLVLDVRRSALLLALDAAFRDRLVGADDAELGACELGQVDSLPDRLGGGLRSVGSNHDASEHAAILTPGTVADPRALRRVAGGQAWKPSPRISVGVVARRTIAIAIAARRQATARPSRLSRASASCRTP